MGIQHCNLANAKHGELNHVCDSNTKINGFIFQPVYVRPMVFRKKINLKFLFKKCQEEML